MEKILIISMTRMGDLLQTTPLLAGLKEERPGCQISLLVNKGFVEICKQIPFIDRLHSFDLDEFIPRLADAKFSLIDNYYYLRDLIEDLRSNGFDMVMNLTHSRVSAVITSLLDAPDTRGLTLDREGHRVIKHPWMNYFFNATQNREFNQYNLVDIHCRCGDVSSKARRLYLDIPSKAREFSEEFLRENGVSDRDWVVGFQAGASQEDKRWPASSFAQLGDTLARSGSAKIILFGSPNEKGLGEEIQSLMKTKVINAVGKTSLAQLAALLSRCDLLITNDTGTMHIACAAGTKVIALFMGSVLSFETGPYGEGNLILEANIPCAPCNHHVECKNPICKKYISPEDVLEAVRMIRSLKEETKDGRRESRNISTSFTSMRVRQLDNSSRYEKVKMFYTAFDEDNMLEFLPLIRRPLTKRDVFNIAYRRMWRIALDSAPPSDPEREEGDGELIECEARKMAEKYSSLFEFEDPQGLQEDVSSLESLIKLSTRGISSCEELIRLSLCSDRMDVNLAKRIGRRLSKIDEEISLLGMTHQSLRPLTLMFNFGKENLEEEGVLPLALRTSRLYRLLCRESSITHRLITGSLEVVRRQDG